MNNQSSAVLLSPEAVAKLDTMELRARTIVEGHFSGQHRSPYKGASVEFADHREYSPGDELRHLDWKVYGRSDRFFIKEFDAETNLNVHLLLDASASMAYGSGAVTKLQYAACLAAGLAYLAIKQRDAAGLMVFDHEVREHLMPATKRSHLALIFERLQAVEPRAETDLSSALQVAAQRLKRRGIVVLLSDLLDEPARVLRALSHFRHRGHDVIVLHVLDDDELRFNFRGPVRFRDLETGQRLLTEATLVREQYLGALQSFAAEYRRGCRERHLDYALVDTSVPYDRALTAYLAKRESLTRKS